MLHLSATLLVIAVVIVVNQVDGQVVKVQQDWDQIAQESQPTRTAITLADGPKYVTAKQSYPSPANGAKQPHKPDPVRPPSKPPIAPNPGLHNKQKYADTPPRLYHQGHNGPPGPYNNPKPIQTKQKNGPYKYPSVIPMNGHHRLQYYAHPGAPPPRQPSLVYSASSGKPVYVTSNSPKFSLPVQTVNGIRSTETRPPKLHHNTTTTTTTTVKPLRNKRIWPKHILDKMNGTPTHNNSLVLSNNSTTNATRTFNDTDYETSASNLNRRYVSLRTANLTTTTSTEATTRVYRRVSRVPKHRSTTVPPTLTTFKPNDWIPLVPSYYQNKRRPFSKNRRSDTQSDFNEQTPAQDRRMLYLHSFGLIPIQRLPTMPVANQKKMYFFRKPKRQLNPNIYSGYSRKPSSRPSRVIYGDLHKESSRRHVTKIKHHHHHHHHKYIKTVEKPVKVPVKVEVPKPYPYPVERRVPYPVEKIKVVEKKVPYPVQVEKKVPYPVQVKVPQPFPVKVVEKEYVPRPYPVVHQVPVYKQIEVKVPHPVPVHVEKRVPYPVQVTVAVPVDRPVAVPVEVEKKVHVPVPYKVYVPQPYPVETKVPYPVEVRVKEPVEVIKHVRVPVRVPVPHPVPIKVPQPFAVEKKVPYPVEVEKKVPVPFRVYVPQRVEVEKKVPVYVPKPYPVEKRVPVPFRVPYPVKVPVQVPIYVGNINSAEDLFYSTATKSPIGNTVSSVSESNAVTGSPQHTVTVHGNGAFSGFSDRSDTTTPTPAP